MELRPALQLQAVIKALSDVVLPSVDPGNKLAQEQAALAIGTLQFMAQRMPLQFRYDCSDLSHMLALSEFLQGQAGELREAQDAVTALEASASAGQAVLSRARAEPLEVERAGNDLRDKVGAVITAASTTRDASALRRINAAIMAHAKEQLLRERAWLAPQGWEPGARFPSIETLIGTGRGA